jgi:hypothetical protein
MMTEARLTSAVLASGFMQLAGQAGGFATVLAKGDPVSGALLLQLLERGEFFSLFERMPDRTGVYQWSEVGPQGSDKKENLESYLDRRQLRDPDLWIVELDVPDAQRFVADIRAST